MRLFLAHHGEAVPKTVDKARPLTDAGRTDVKRMAEFLATTGIRMNRVIHSDKERAIDTAAILASRLASEVTMEMRAGIRPDDVVEPLASESLGWDGNVLVAGHGPFFSRLVARLVAEDEGKAVIASKPGSVICLERDETGKYGLAWMVRPELLP